MVSKTRERLIEVARQLFLKKGVENTTMNDIATASEKGRRTIYTYFKNKREIFNAVIEQQSELVIGELREAAEADAEPLVKLERYLSLRFRLLEDFHIRSERTRFFFRGDHRRFTKILQLIMDKERAIMQAMMEEGVAAGAFDPVQAQRLPSLELMLSRGIDLSRLADSQSAQGVIHDSLRHDIIEFIIEGIRNKSNVQS